MTQRSRARQAILPPKEKINEHVRERRAAFSARQFPLATGGLFGLVLLNSDIMSCAICMTGYLRTFGEIGVAETIEALRASIHAHAIAVVSNDGEDTFKGQSSALDPEVVTRGRQRVLFARWIELPHSDQVSKLQRCLSEVDEMERSHRRAKPFQWIIRIRPDATYSPVPARWLDGLRDDTVYRSDNSGDVMLVAPRRLASEAYTPRREVFFVCGCDIIRTLEAARLIRAIGLRQTGLLVNHTTERRIATRYPKVSLKRWRLGWGVTPDMLQRPSERPIYRDAYRLLESKPWSAG